MLQYEDGEKDFPFPWGEGEFFPLRKASGREREGKQPLPLLCESERKGLSLSGRGVPALKTMAPGQGKACLLLD